MIDAMKCVRCGFRYVTKKAKENFEVEGLPGESVICLTCIGELTQKVINDYGYLVYPAELEASNKRMAAMPRTIANCRPCMKKNR
nr:hypothetical protein [Paenibacillus arenosi]